MLAEALKNLQPLSTGQAVASPRLTYSNRRVTNFPRGESPLETSWNFWYEKKNPNHKLTSEDYQKGLNLIGSCNTIESLARIFSFIKPASKQPVDHNIAFFRHGTMPMWEDMPNGGTWILKVPKKVGQEVIDSIWEMLVFACASESFCTPDVCGVVLSSRTKEDVFSIWNETNIQPEIRQSIAEKLRDILHLPPNVSLNYKENRQALYAVSALFDDAPSATVGAGMETVVLSDVEKRRGIAFTPNIDAMHSPIVNSIFSSLDLSLPEAVLEEDSMH